MQHKSYITSTNFSINKQIQINSFSNIFLLKKMNYYTLLLILKHIIDLLNHLQNRKSKSKSGKKKDLSSTILTYFNGSDIVALFHHIM